MVSDEERREVARGLLAVAKKLGPNMDAHEFAHYTADVLDVDDSMTWYEMELRLADLIYPSDMSQGRRDIVACDRDAPGHEHTQRSEPSELKVKCVAEFKVDGEQLEKLVHDAVVELTGIDRDALLALADKARKLGDEESGPASFAVRCTFRVFARSIYKALGVGE